MKFLNKNTLLILILALAAVLRFYKLDTYPALNADEAAISYNVYSLIQTGQDEHGNPWPIHFQSFNDYKPGGYFYIVLPFVWAFGLNEWSVRLPGAIFGVLTVLFVYLLVKELQKWQQFKILNYKFEIIASFLLAISPWHIHFSRGGWEVNAATFFIVVGVYFFLRAIRNNKYFALSAIFFVLSLYTYHAARIVTPLLGVVLLIIYRKDLFSSANRKLFLGSVILGAVLLVPLLTSFVGEASARASGVSIFSDRGYIDRIEEKRARHEDPFSVLNRILYNKPKELAIEFSKNYFEHFKGEFLFISGDDIERNKVPELGQLYLWQFPILIIALYAISKKSKGWGLVLAWLVISPITAALTFQSPHALRAQSMIIPLTILSAYGLTVILKFLNENIRKRGILTTCYILLTTVLGWSFAHYLHQYYVHMAKTYPYSSQYGVKELVEYMNENVNNTEPIVVTTRYDQPYILFLFYTKFDPKQFQGHHILTARDKYGFSTVPAFNNYIFKSINYKDEDRDKFPGAILVGTDEEIPDAANVIKNIYGSNNYLYFQVVAN